MNEISSSSSATSSSSAPTISNNNNIPEQVGENNVDLAIFSRSRDKLRQARALKRFFVGYSCAKYLQPCYRVVAKYANGTYGRVSITKDVIFDLTINFKSDLEKDLPTLGEFNSIPSLELVHDQDNADALRRQLIMSPATQEVTVPIPTDAPAPPVGTLEASSTLTSDPYLPSDADVYNDAAIGTKYDEEGNI